MKEDYKHTKAIIIIFAIYSTQNLHQTNLILEKIIYLLVKTGNCPMRISKILKKYNIKVEQ